MERHTCLEDMHTNAQKKTFLFLLLLLLIQFNDGYVFARHLLTPPFRDHAFSLQYRQLPVNFGLSGALSPMIAMVFIVLLTCLFVVKFFPQLATTADNLKVLGAF